MHRVTFNGLVDVPFGKGRRFGKDSNRFIDTVLGGFQVAFVGTMAFSWVLERLVLPPWLRFSLALPLLVLNLWVLRQLLQPLAPFPALFLTAALLAFLLDLPVRWLVSRGVPRPVALLLVLGLSLGGLALAAIVLVPRLLEQLDELITALPGWLAQGETLLNALQQWAQEIGRAHV